MPNYLCSYRPLCLTRQGRDAVTQSGMLPFVDGSCRREPDFENNHPSITALCRGRVFAPRLYEGDRVIYITTKNFYGQGFKHWKLVGALEVVRRSTHEEAYDWYMDNALPIPSNCMTQRDAYLPMHLTSGNPLTIRQWNHHYMGRATDNDVFLRCLHVVPANLVNPRGMTEADFYAVIGGDPQTRNPQTITDEQFEELTTLLENKNA